MSSSSTDWTATDYGRAVAAYGVLVAAEGEEPQSADAMALNARLTTIAAGSDGPLQWRCEGPAPPADLRDEPDRRARSLAAAWAAFVGEAASGPRLEVHDETRGGSEHLHVVQAVTRPGVGTASAYAFKKAVGIAQWHWPLTLGVWRDPPLMEQLTPESALRPLVRIVDATDGKASCDLLLFPRPPSNPLLRLSSPPATGAQCVLMLEDPRAPLDRTADFVWEPALRSPAPAIGIVPLNRRHVSRWLTRLLARFDEDATLDVALRAASGRHDPPPFLVASTDVVGASPKVTGR